MLHFFRKGLIFFNQEKKESKCLLHARRPMSKAKNALSEPIRALLKSNMTVLESKRALSEQKRLFRCEKCSIGAKAGPLCPKGPGWRLGGVKRHVDPFRAFGGHGPVPPPPASAYGRLTFDRLQPTAVDQPEPDHAWPTQSGLTERFRHTSIVPESRRRSGGIYRENWSTAVRK